MKTLKNNKGFNPIELIIVIAILFIGLSIVSTFFIRCSRLGEPTQVIRVEDDRGSRGSYGSRYGSRGS